MMDAYEERRTVRARRARKKGGPVYFDIIVIIAIYLTVAGFSGLKDLYSIVQPGTVFYCVCLVTSIITNAAPFLIFMVAGAKILPQEETTRYNLKKRILPILGLLLIFSFLYYQSDVRLGRDELNLGNFFLDLYARDRVIPFSYVYAFLGFLISLPLLRPMAQNMRDRDFVYLFILVFVLESVLPFVDDLFFIHRYEMNPNLKLSWVVNYIVVYPLAGYFVQQRADRKMCFKALAWLWSLTVLWFILVIWRSYEYVMNWEYITTFMGYHSQLYFPMSLAFFISVRLIFESKHRSRVLSQIAATGYGIYFAQDFFNNRGGVFAEWRFKLLNVNLGMGMWFAFLLWALIICLICGVVTWILQRLYAAIMRKE